MGLNRDFQRRKLVLSNLMGIRLAILDMTRLGEVEMDEEEDVVEEDAEEAIGEGSNFAKIWLWLHRITNENSKEN